MIFDYALAGIVTTALLIYLIYALLKPDASSSSPSPRCSASRHGGRLRANRSGVKCFHGRPSATTAPDPNDSTKTVPAPYNAANSGGSTQGSLIEQNDLGPSNKALIARVQGDIGRRRKNRTRRCRKTWSPPRPPASTRTSRRT
jgi:K+-transporting ATPase KdpF subunit